MDDTEPTDEGMTLDDLARQQALIGTAVRKMGKTVSKIAADVAPKQKAVPDLEMDQLIHWVSWLTTTYELGAAIPACWPRHGALIEEFATLYIAWIDTLDQAGTAGTVWHDYLDRSLGRIDGRWRTCIDGEHRARTPPNWTQSGPDGADELKQNHRPHPAALDDLADS